MELIDGDRTVNYVKLNWIIYGPFTKNLTRIWMSVEIFLYLIMTIVSKSFEGTQRTSTRPESLFYCLVQENQSPISGVRFRSDGVQKHTRYSTKNVKQIYQFVCFYFIMKVVYFQFTLSLKSQIFTSKRSYVGTSKQCRVETDEIVMSPSPLIDAVSGVSDCMTTGCT